MDCETDGSDFNGTLSSMLVGGKPPKNGKVSGNNVEGLAKVSVQGQLVDTGDVGTVEGATMKGTLDSPFGMIPFNASRKR
ncbi:MAG: hypothetical protein IPJ30_10005 [Acidobacteria bacterium]|nr:hypothetical protein [Acidobacteriota bacterium]